MFTSLLIANRGEIACRIMRTAKRMGIRTIAVYAAADENAMHVREADEAVFIGPSIAAESYLNIDAIMAAAAQTGAAAIHPGYGFLSENQELAASCERAGIIFVGPSVHSMQMMSLKDEAKRIMQAAGVPVTPGYHGEDQRDETLAMEAEKIGYPVLIKAVAGGGGRGMRRADQAEAFAEALLAARREAKSAFGDDRVLVEKYITNPRHIEVQIFGDRRGRITHFYERDCSVQRRHQKVIEESPALGMNAEVRSAICAAAVKAARAVSYENAGTVEFIVDGSGPLRPDGFWFMEMNTRLQVEHPVSEAVTGYDLVELQLKIAAGGSVPEQDQVYLRGHAIEVRLYAEDPANNYMPSTGKLAHFVLPDAQGVRVDTGYQQGDQVSEHYDPMLAKIIVNAPTRKLAIEKAHAALTGVESWPVRVNAGFLGRALTMPAFKNGAVDTGFVNANSDVLYALKHTLAYKAAVTALVAQITAANKPAKSPWDQADGWRLNQQITITRSFSCENETFHVCLTRIGNGAGAVAGAGSVDWQLCCGEMDIIARNVRLDGGVVCFDLDGVPLRARNLAHANGVNTFINGDAWYMGDYNPAATIAAGSASLVIVAPMPGKVLSVKAQAGALAKSGEALVILEAMKMEHALTAPADLMVAQVDVKAGDQVSAGEELIKFDPPEQIS